MFHSVYLLILPNAPNKFWLDMFQVQLIPVYYNFFFFPTIIAISLENSPK